MVISWPAVARATHGSTRIGTVPRSRTATCSEPPATARPSETVSATVLTPVVSPPSVKTTTPSGLNPTWSGARDRRGRQVDGVAVRIDPVGETCVDTRPPDATVAVELRTAWGGEFSSATAHGDRDHRARGTAATVADRVSEGDRAGGVAGEGELQLLVAADQVDAPDGLVERVDGGHHEHVAVGVVVVEQHGQHARATGSGAELVVHGDRRLLHLLQLGRGLVVRFRLVLLLVLVEDQLIPVVDQLALGLHGPAGPARLVVQGDPGAVHREAEGGSRRHLLQIEFHRIPG